MQFNRTTPRIPNPLLSADEERTIIRLALRQATQIFQIHADKMSQIQQPNRNIDIFEYSCRQVVVVISIISIIAISFSLIVWGLACHVQSGNTKP